MGRDVVNDNGNGRVADVGGDEGAEAFLAGGVPELEADGAVFEVHCLQDGSDWVFLQKRRGSRI